MKRSAPSFKLLQGKEQSDVGVQDLRAMFGNMEDSLTLSTSKGQPVQVDQGPPTSGRRQQFDPRAELRYQHHQGPFMRDDHQQAGAYIVRLCRCLDQVGPDNGTWTAGASVLLKLDPVLCQEAMKRLKKTYGETENGKDKKKAV